MIFNEFQDNVIKWSTDRGIIQNGTVFSQCLKLASEFGELCDAIAKGDTVGTMDGIGDCQVVAVNIAHMDGGYLKLRGGASLVRREGLHVPDLLAGIASAIADIFSGRAILEYPDECAQTITTKLAALSVALDLHHSACLETAWNEIKDRKGYLNENGVFIKEGG